MDERDPDRVIVEEEPRRVERETTIINTGGVDGDGGSGTIVAVLLLLVILVLGFLWFNGTLGGAADEVGINVNVDAPDLPDVDIDVPAPSQPANSS